MGRIQSNLASRVKKGRMTEQMAQAAMSRVQVWCMGVHGRACCRMAFVACAGERLQ